MQRFQQQWRDEQQAKQVARHPDLLRAEDSMHIKLAALDIDVKRLRSLTTLADRIDMKSNDLLPKWEPVAREYVESGKAYPNPILVYCIIWLIDVRRFDTALAWADLAIEQGQEMPPNIKSRMPAFIAASIYDWAEMEAEAGRTVEPYFQQVFDRVARHWRLHERIASKYYRFAALWLLRDHDGKPRASSITDVALLEKADRLLAKAAELHPKIQVKTMRQRIAARIRALTDRD
ncbi:terminase [Salmonella enterica]|uniref:Terminase n=1 Tax=Salmonella enterica TaxID=28901 RepID=A0A760VK38_SALER|nr:terminase [Salmonella enterica subsp. enterica serovar Chester]EAO8773957.1 terminase [Salmonella enterica]EBQ9004558.1 terminase [Salmonella enterica subsp. enterica serovar Blockley]EBQ9479900.1 terminase [Salmonella enterica subsp. enterica serovar Kokomlemle]EBY7078022.1 terminase [Salmonella enterica subsp. enterica serovar Ealing]EBZ5138269.1 terminase [Salmonella enterica subsp. enterica serovar Antsalova]ECD6162182.1 terminase [Salmonella enterica subsp. enterica]ECU7994813.1 term